MIMDAGVRLLRNYVIGVGAVTTAGIVAGKIDDRRWREGLYQRNLENYEPGRARDLAQRPHSMAQDLPTVAVTVGGLISLFGAISAAGSSNWAKVGAQSGVPQVLGVGAGLVAGAAVGGLLAQVPIESPFVEGTFDGDSSLWKGLGYGFGGMAAGFLAVHLLRR